MIMIPYGWSPGWNKSNCFLEKELSKAIVHRPVKAKDGLPLTNICHAVPNPAQPSSSLLVSFALDISDIPPEAIVFDPELWNVPEFCAAAATAASRRGAEHQPQAGRFGSRTALSPSHSDRQGGGVLHQTGPLRNPRAARRCRAKIRFLSAAP